MAPVPRYAFLVHFQTPFGKCNNTWLLYSGENYSRGCRSTLRLCCLCCQASIPSSFIFLSLTHRVRSRRRYIPDVITTPRLLEPLLPHTSTFVLLQNGIGVHEDLRRVAPTATIISVCAWVDATAINGGNVIAHGRMVSFDLILASSYFSLTLLASL
jgi:Ketopantoate reductase PanE/ApbA